MFRALVLLSTFVLPPLCAQVRELAPYRYQGGSGDALRRQDRLALPSLQHRRALPAAHRLAPVSADELQGKPKPLATRAGVHRGVGRQAPVESGRWDLLDDGRAVWRMALQSPGAAGVRIHFRDFRLPPGAKLWLHDGSGGESEIMGPYEGQGVYGDGEFWSDFVLAETIVIEYAPGPGTGGGTLPFTIAEISHLLPGALPEAITADRAQALLSPLAWTGSAVDPRQAAASCQLDISCFPSGPRPRARWRTSYLKKTAAAMSAPARWCAAPRPITSRISSPLTTA